MSTKIFFDTEFTGLHKNTTLISLGMVSEDDRTFYAEFNDYDKSQVDDWIQNNVIGNLIYNHKRYVCLIGKDFTRIKAHTASIKSHLEIWLSQFDDYELWNDCLSYDWVLLADLLSGIGGVHEDDNYYYPSSVCSLDEIKGIDCKILQEIKGNPTGNEHNSLYDANLIKQCYKKAIELEGGPE